MIIKAYIKRHMFHLPMKELDLLEQVEKELGGENFDKEDIEKLYPLTKIEENDNIMVENQRTNIFLLNLLLWVLNHNGKEIIDQEYYNEELMISKLEEETHLELRFLPFNEVEKEINNYLTPAPVQTKSKEHSYLKNVIFSVEWLKRAQQELNSKGRK